MSLSTSIATCFYSGFKIRTPVQSTDSGGANVKNFIDGSAFDGHIRRLSSSEIIANSKRMIESTHRLYCAHGTAITKINRITFDSKEYQVVSNPDDVHELGEFLQIELFYDEN